MTQNAKWRIVKAAQMLIYRLEECDNEEFRDRVLNCVMSADDFTLEEMMEE